MTGATLIHESIATANESLLEELVVTGVLIVGVPVACPLGDCALFSPYQLRC